MRMFLLVLLMMRAFGFLTLVMLFHGSAEPALFLAEIPHGHDGTLVRSEVSAPEAAMNGHSSSSRHPPSSSVYKHYQFGKHKHSSIAQIPTDAMLRLSPSSSLAQSPSPLKEPPTPYHIPILDPSTIRPLPYVKTDCPSDICIDPFTPSLSGSPCECVLPIDILLRLNVTIFTFLPLVSMLQKEIAASTSLTISQVRIIGAEVDYEQGSKTYVRVLVDNKLFDDFEVIYVHYPGLPPSPPQLSSNAAVVKSPHNNGTETDV